MVVSLKPVVSGEVGGRTKIPPVSMSTTTGFQVLTPNLDVNTVIFLSEFHWIPSRKKNKICTCFNWNHHCSRWGPNFYPLFLNQKTKNKCWNQAYSNSASTGCNYITNWPLTYPAREGENINIESECKGVKDTFYIVVLYWLVNYLSIHQGIFNATETTVII